MTAFDWPVLLTTGVQRPGLRPEEFWRLPAAEFGLTTGEGPVGRPARRRRRAGAGAAGGGGVCLVVAGVKMDGSLGAKCGEDSAKYGMVQAIVTLGKSLNLALVGECVETANQQQMLAKLGCDYLQGYLLSRPLSADAAASALQSTSLR